MLELPKKDRDGNSYLSYSQIKMFKNSEQEYYENYILGKKFEGNAYTDFGSKVGEALETGDFTKFEKTEAGILKQVTRLDEFERKVKLDYDNFYVTGYIDTNKSDFNRIIDYKTGGKNKEHRYSQDDYTQLHIYALALRQETGTTPMEASVEFIRREGNAFRGQKLIVAKEPVQKIEVNISEKRLKEVYRDIWITAREIEAFYKHNRID